MRPEFPAFGVCRRLRITTKRTIRKPTHWIACAGTSWRRERRCWRHLRITQPSCRIYCRERSSKLKTRSQRHIGEIAAGVIILLGVGTADIVATATSMAEMVAKLRIYEEDEGKIRRCL